MKEYYEDDRRIVPDYIKKMSVEELDAFIEKRKAKIIKQNAHTVKSQPKNMRPTA